MNHPSKFTPIIIGTSVMTVISLFPVLNLINLICCAGIIAGGFAGTAYYAKQLDKAGADVIQFKDGAAIGLLSGLLTAIIVILFFTIITMLTSQNPVPEIYKMIDNWGINVPPEAEKFLKRVSDEYTKNGFSITLLLINFGANIITYPLFGSLGGIIASSIYSKKRNAR